MFPSTTLLAAVTLALAGLGAASPAPASNATMTAPVGKRCTGTISSLADVAAAVKCTTININSFTVTAGQTFEIDAPSGATINLLGDVTFGYKEWAGPLMVVKGTSVTFNGNGHQLLGQGEQYWDGQGGSGGKTKPAPLLRINHSGTFKNVIVKNSPMRAVAVGGASIVVDSVTVDNSDGDTKGGHNTDGFDVSSDGPVTIQNSKDHGQDDCLAINRGTGITFKNNVCTGPTHGISIGSINSNTVVKTVVISGNTVSGADNGLRIKTDAAASGSSVSGVTFSGNTLSGITKYGVLIDQSYPATLGTPGTGVVISGITFSGTNTMSVASSAARVDVNCGSGACTGTWDWSGLKVTGGKAGSVKNAKISGGTY